MSLIELFGVVRAFVLAEEFDRYASFAREMKKNVFLGSLQTSQQEEQEQQEEEEDQEEEEKKEEKKEKQHKHVLSLLGKRKCSPAMPNAHQPKSSLEQPRSCWPWRKAPNWMRTCGSGCLGEGTSPWGAYGCVFLVCWYVIGVYRCFLVFFFFLNLKTTSTSLVGCCFWLV